MSRPRPVYERKNNVRTWLLETGEIKVEAYFEDAVHFILLQMTVERASGCILEIESRFLRSPYPDLCPLSLKSYAALKGMEIKKGFHSRVSERIPKEQGCVHIQSLLREAADAVVQSFFYLTAHERDGEERREFLKTQLKDICAAYHQE